MSIPDLGAEGQRRKMVGLFTVAGVFSALGAVLLPFVAPALRRHALPYIPTTKSQVDAIVKLCRGRPGPFLDLGSGDGRIVIEVAKQLGIPSHGIELNPWLVFFSKLRAALSGPDVFKQTSFKVQDLWTVSVQEYDVIMVFGVQDMMAELDERILSKASPTARIISCEFKLPGREPTQQIQTDGSRTLWVFDVDANHPHLADANNNNNNIDKANDPRVDAM
eukprot:m.90366 g.90366  ORF g.90366 m.90366 type:complete len:221 (+) comp12915_c0_seq5:331-993(+)